MCWPRRGWRQWLRRRLMINTLYSLMARRPLSLSIRPLTSGHLRIYQVSQTTADQAPPTGQPLFTQLTWLITMSTAGGKFSDPHISRPPDFEGKKLPKIFRLIRGNIRYLHYYKQCNRCILLLLIRQVCGIKCLWVTSDSTVQPQIDRDQFGNISNLDLVKPNRTKSGTPYMPALDCYLLTYWHWKCRIHALTVRWCKIFTRC